ncbi:MAG: 2,3-bisphosphoglycerate-independent phosphoglycerate mutase [Prevotellaceae bacterium]|jgi:2,3-bisphosphoglycerate-independent phosphoglycerate mutase|nr:2,3-bisphosphoglycerate-independent phosphoglycerate mutase [Prevotellaceae bacterium]
MSKRVLLMILDGWGIGRRDHSNVIFSAGAPHIEALTAQYPHAQLLASGENVGLPDGQMGNSEVGHLNIGAGRVVYQDLVKINRAARDNSILENEEIKQVYDYVKKNNKQLHLLGLVSDGGVHSSLEHLFKLCDIGKAYGIEKLFVHCFMDGRDTDPKSGLGFIQQLQAHLEKSAGTIASVVGRYYAMDRDKRWERVKVAYDLLVEGKGAAITDAAQGVQQSYAAGVTDEFIKPLVCTESGKPVATIQPGDAVIFFNFRNDRAKELTIVLTQDELLKKAQQEAQALGSVASTEAKAAIAAMKNIPLYYCTITPYDDKFKGLHVLFDKDNVQNTLGETLAKAGKKQLRIAETEKYAHVTFFFSGGREEVFPGEERILVPSPKVATYDLKPEMSACEVADALVEALNKQTFDFVALNFANGDMVGHTGVYEAITKAVKAVDGCVGKVVEAAQRNGYTVLITADHGNADYAENPDGSPNTAHSLNPVPFVVVDNNVKAVHDGILADIAPTVLKLMEIPQPAEMTGRVLVDF